MHRILPLLTAVFAVGLVPVRANLLEGLSPADQAKVKAGAQVVVTESLEGYPWPRVKVYQKVDASPREVMAVFFDYDNARNFIPNCLKSAIAKKVDAATCDVDYVIDVPILPDEAYTVRNTLSAGDSGALKVQWRVLKATSIEESAGNLLVEPFGAGSLLCYTNLVKPSSRAAILLRGMALSQMKDTVKALVDQVEKCVKNPAGMQAPLGRLDEALSSGGK